MSRRGSEAACPGEAISRRTFLRAGGLAALAAVALRAPAGPPRAPTVRFLRRWGRKGTGPGEFDVPIGVAVGAGDEVFVTDFRNARVQKFTAEGRLLSAFGVGPFPGGIAVDRSGNVFVSHFPGFSAADLAKGAVDKVTVHDATGKSVRQWGTSGSGP